MMVGPKSSADKITLYFFTVVYHMAYPKTQKIGEA